MSLTDAPDATPTTPPTATQAAALTAAPTATLAAVPTRRAPFPGGGGGHDYGNSSTRRTRTAGVLKPLAALRKGCPTEAAKPAEAGPQAPTYAVSSNPPWRLLTATSAPARGETPEGNARPHSMKGKQQQGPEGHVGSSGGVSVNDSAAPSGVLVDIERETDITQATPRTVELAPPGPRAQAEIAMLPEAPGDSTEGARGGPSHGVGYMVSEAGHLMMFTATKAPGLMLTRVSRPSTSIPVSNELQIGAIFANRKG